MPMKINIGLSKKLGLPEYSSVGASCAVELEVESSLLQTDLEAFHRHVRGAYTACRQAVHDELARHQPGAQAASGYGNGNGGVAPSSQAASPGAAHNGNGREGQSPGQSGQGSAQTASERQVAYLRQLAGQIQGLGLRKLDALARKSFGIPVVAISSAQASSLIDTLKAVRLGEVDLESLLDREAA